VFVPAEAVENVIVAMTGAGAGRIGDYERCSFAAEGVGRFTPPSGAAPYSGTPGAASSAPEQRVEMVAPRARVKGVVAAAVSAHPYEEPLVTVGDVVVARNAARLGMLSEVTGESQLTLGEFVDRAASAFSVTPRVWGNPSMLVSRCATSTGSAGALIGDALAGGAQVLVAGEVRYHDALDALGSGLAVVELGHDVSEWPLVGLLEAVVRAVPRRDQQTVHTLPAAAGWWTPRYGSEERP
jgi:hypothetical protein